MTLKIFWPLKPLTVLSIFLCADQLQRRLFSVKLYHTKKTCSINHAYANPLRLAYNLYIFSSSLWLSLVCRFHIIRCINLIALLLTHSTQLLLSHSSRSTANHNENGTWIMQVQRILTVFLSFSCCCFSSTRFVLF